MEISIFGHFPSSIPFMGPSLVTQTPDCHIVCFHFSFSFSFIFSCFSIFYYVAFLLLFFSFSSFFFLHYYDIFVLSLFIICINQYKFILLYFMEDTHQKDENIFFDCVDQR